MPPKILKYKPFSFLSWSLLIAPGGLPMLLHVALNEEEFECQVIGVDFIHFLSSISVFKCKYK